MCPSKRKLVNPAFIFPSDMPGLVALFYSHVSTCNRTPVGDFLCNVVAHLNTEAAEQTVFSLNSVS